MRISNLSGSVPTGPMEVIQPDVTAELQGEQHNTRNSNSLRSLVALGLAGAVAAGLVACSNEGDDSRAKNDATEVSIPEQQEQFCEAEPLRLNQYQEVIKNYAAEAMPTIGENDVQAMRSEFAEQIPQNVFGVASIKALLDQNTQTLSIANLKASIQTEVSNLFGDAKARDEACQSVVGEFLTKGDRIVPTAAEYFEVGPVYKENGNIDTNNISFQKVNPFANPETSIDQELLGFFVPSPDGRMQAFLTKEGRLLIPITAGDENGTTNFDPNAETEELSFTTKEGNEITVTTLPNGDKKVKTTTPQGEVSESITPAANFGGGTGPAAGNQGKPNGKGPGGEGPECDANAEGDCKGPAGGVTPENPGPGPGPGPEGPGPEGPGTTTTTQKPTTTTTQKPTTTTTQKPTTTTTQKPTTTTTQKPTTTTTQKPTTTTTQKPTTTTTTPKGSVITIPGAPR